MITQTRISRISYFKDINPPITVQKHHSREHFALTKDVKKDETSNEQFKPFKHAALIIFHFLICLLKTFPGCEIQRVWEKQKMCRFNPILSSESSCSGFIFTFVCYQRDIISNKDQDAHTILADAHTAADHQQLLSSLQFYKSQLFALIVRLKQIIGLSFGWSCICSLLLITWMFRYK